MNELYLVADQGSVGSVDRQSIARSRAVSKASTFFPSIDISYNDRH